MLNGNVFRRAAGVCCAVLLLTMFASLAQAAESEAALLWPDGAPGAKGEEEKDKPKITVWLPEKEKATGAGVVVCPGGGYGHLAVDHEGKRIAAWLNSFGVAAFVLDYRHNGKGYQHPAPLQDVQRAIRLVRGKADEYGVRKDRIGVLGFSAGGHLASTAATHFDGGDSSAADAIDQASCRPDFAVLCYAVIMFDEDKAHRGSQKNLLGDKADPELIKSLSNEKQVTKETPPTFLWHTDEDGVVPSENSVQFYLALRKAGVPAELHIFRQGRHGVGLGADINGANQWPKLCEAWLAGLGMLEK